MKPVGDGPDLPCVLGAPSQALARKLMIMNVDPVENSYQFFIISLSLGSYA